MVVVRKPVRWSPMQQLVVPWAQHLWRGAQVVPIWEYAGDTIYSYPTNLTNTGAGTFPTWSGGNLNFTASNSEHIRFPSDMGISQLTAFSLLTVFRTTSETAQTFWCEGNSGTDNAILDTQVRGDQAENYVRIFLRGNASSTFNIDWNSNGSGYNYADGEWHAFACTIKDSTVASGGFRGFVDGLNTVTNDVSNATPPGARTMDQWTLGALSRISYSEYMDGDIALQVLWTRALSDRELQQVSTDPFAMLRPIYRIAGRDVRTCSAETNKRAASILMPLPFVILPCPDGSIGLLDRRQAAFIYPILGAVDNIRLLTLLGVGR